ncbi:MAG TPA: anthranilate phosphoribosyltransferase [Pseudogracilibacillus sp.]|nr:anthranilate phosphoribosyltransferase [Pseudogracilibacillus sp.]
MKDYLQKLMNNRHLTFSEIKEATNRCLTGNISDTEIAAFLTALRMKGETPEEIAGIVEVIRGKSELSSLSFTNVMDNCGTGGDRSNSFNISTTSAFVLAGAGITVAKHGNRSISSQTGSADVLEQLGVSLSFSKEQIEQILKENNIVFLFAPHVHTNLRPFMKVRNELGLPTVFNLIGPLTNPLELDSQVIGVYDRTKLKTIAESLKELGRKRAVVLNGAGYMDEASLAGENHLVLLNDGEIESLTLHPHDIDLNVYDNDAIKGGDAKRNAEILLSVLRNEPSPYLDTVLLNSAIGFYANGMAPTIKDGVQIARETIASGKALKRLETLVQFSKRIKEAM